MCVKQQINHPCRNGSYSVKLGMVYGIVSPTLQPTSYDYKESSPTITRWSHDNGKPTCNGDSPTIILTILPILKSTCHGDQPTIAGVKCCRDSVVDARGHQFRLCPQIFTLALCQNEQLTSLLKNCLYVYIYIICMYVRIYISMYIYIYNLDLSFEPYILSLNEYGFAMLLCGYVAKWSKVLREILKANALTSISLEDHLQQSCYQHLKY